MNLINIRRTRISCKSGQLVKNKVLGTNCVKFNGSRTTSYKTLGEKIRHLSKSHDDYYFMLSKPKPFNFKYKLLVFNSSICRVDKLDWVLSKSGKSWNGSGQFSATIGKSMSDQLWTTMPINKIQYVIDIDCIKAARTHGAKPAIILQNPNLIFNPFLHFKCPNLFDSLKIIYCYIVQ